MRQRLIVMGALLLFLIGTPGLAAAATDGSQDSGTPIDRRVLEERAGQSLDVLVDSYRQKNHSAFMTCVAPDFRGDSSVIDQAVRRDFLLLDDIDLRYSVVSVSVGEDRVGMTVSYQRRVIAAKDGKSYKDSGLTQLLFVSYDGQLRLFSMRYPLLFGLSDARSLVAGGIVASPENAEVLTIDRQGAAAVVPFRQALQELGL